MVRGDVRRGRVLLPARRSPRLFGDHALPQGPMSFTRDGKRALVGVTPDEDALGQLTVVMNWAADLRNESRFRNSPRT